MKIVYLHGGLGNQLFQWSFGQWLNIRGEDVTIDSSGVSRYHDRVGIRGLKLLGVPVCEAFSLPNWSPVPLQKVANRTRAEFLGLTSLKLGDDWAFRELNSEIRAILPGRVFFKGLFQFNSLVTDLLDKDPSLYDFDNADHNLISNAAAGITVHVRRGDFTHTQGILGPEYYKQALEMIGWHPKVELRVFSDSPKMAHSLLRSLGARNVVLGDPSGLPAWKLLELMQRSETLIASNSTLSWWAARLSRGQTVLPYPIGPRLSLETLRRAEEMRISGSLEIPSGWD